MSNLTPQQVEEFGRLRTIGQMLAGFVHQLRTPLSVLQSTVEDLKAVRKLPKEATSRLDMMQRSIDRMQSAVQTLLGYARGDSGELDEGSLNKVIERVCDYLQEECPRRKIQLNKSLDGTVPGVALNATHLEEALINLTVNAMESMPNGGTLNLSTQASPDGQYVLVTIRDQGQGMTPEALATIGKPFQTSKTKGLGLGLYLTKRIAEAHHAQLDFESQVGKGTIVTMTFPRWAQQLKSAA